MKTNRVLSDVKKSADGKTQREKTQRGMANALSASLAAETDAFQQRLQRAEQVMSPPSITSQANASSDDKVSLSDETPSVPRVVRDAFTMPESDYALIEKVQRRCLNKAVRISKSEALRAGLQALDAMSDEQLVSTVEALQKVPVGRPPSRGVMRNR